MMKEYSEPHFDDERTVLRARRVVPLEKIEAKARHRRQWFLGGAFALAMILGAASALVASYVKLRKAPQAVTEVPVEPDVVPAPVATVASTPEATPVPAEDQVAETTPPVTPKKEAAPKHRTTPAQPILEPIDDRDTRQASEAEQLQQIRDAVLYDQWQERRARRVERREHRRADRYNHRDLSNLDEIFEGRRRGRP
jgi:type IV secretory pathway VirB10-like protein